MLRSTKKINTGTDSGLDVVVTLRSGQAVFGIIVFAAFDKITKIPALFVILYALFLSIGIFGEHPRGTKTAPVNLLPKSTNLQATSI